MKVTFNKIPFPIKSQNVGIKIELIMSEPVTMKYKVNNTSIKNRDFYNPNMVFILENDNLDNLYDFLNKNNDNYNKKIKEYYSFNNWLNNFRNR